MSESVTSQQSRNPKRGALEYSEIARLIANEYSGLILLVRRKLKDRDRASDLVNEAIAVTLEHAGQGRLTEGDRIGGYVFQVSMNLLRNELRNFDNREEFRARAEDVDTLETIDVDEVETDQIREKTRKLLLALPNARDREIIKRFYLDEEEKHDICANLGLTPLQFTQVISRARQRMRLIFESEGHQRRDLFSLIPLVFYLLGCNIS